MTLGGMAIEIEIKGVQMVAWTFNAKYEMEPKHAGSRVQMQDC
jgi:hypothetical protein